MPRSAKLGSLVIVDGFVLAVSICSLNFSNGGVYVQGKQRSGSHLDGLIVEQRVDGSVTRLVVCLVHLYPETSPGSTKRQGC